MFYPNIIRRKKYPTKLDGTYYATYNHYRDEITEDCKQRCVYCDITLTENGGEGMQLDHFKPQEHFSHLHNDPRNLVLACQKCNRLKSDHWPIDVAKNINGFLDPFTKNRVDWYVIKKCGSLEHTNIETGLKIELLKLNRPARIQIRRKRLIEERISVIDDVITKKLNALQTIIEDEDNSKKVDLLAEVLSLKEKIDTLRKL